MKIALDTLVAKALVTRRNPDLRLLPGGLSQGRRFRVDPHELEMGILVELEHVDHDWLLAREIALDHLYEDPHYYSKLARMQAGKCNRRGAACRGSRATLDLDALVARPDGTPPLPQAKEPRSVRSLTSALYYGHWVRIELYDSDGRFVATLPATDVPLRVHRHNLPPGAPRAATGRTKTLRTRYAVALDWLRKHGKIGYYVAVVNRKWVQRGDGEYGPFGDEVVGPNDIYRRERPPQWTEADLWTRDYSRKTKAQIAPTLAGRPRLALTQR